MNYKIFLLLILLSIIGFLLIVNQSKLATSIQVISQEEMLEKYSFASPSPLVLPDPCKQAIPGLQFTSLNCP